MFFFLFVLPWQFGNSPVVVLVPPLTVFPELVCLFPHFSVLKLNLSHTFSFVFSMSATEKKKKEKTCKKCILLAVTLHR